MYSIVGTLGLIQVLLLWLIVGVVLALSLWALIHCATTPPRAFAVEGKRTKNFWLAVTIAGLVLSILTIPPYGPLGPVSALFVLIIPGVYLTDVRPAVASWRRKPRSGSGGDAPWGQRRPGPRDW